MGLGGGGGKSSATLLVVFQSADEAVYGFAGDVLHHHHMRKLSAETRVFAVGKVVVCYNLVGGAAEEHGVAVVVAPAGPAYGCELLLEIVGALKHLSGLGCPATLANILLTLSLFRNFSVDLPYKGL